MAVIFRGMGWVVSFFLAWRGLRWGGGMEVILGGWDVVGLWHSALTAEYFCHILVIKYVYKCVKF